MTHQPMYEEEYDEFKPEHTCCWHYTGGYTNSVSKTDDFQCCHCGKLDHKTTTFSVPAGHGPYCPLSADPYYD